LLERGEFELDAEIESDTCRCGPPSMHCSTPPGRTAVPCATPREAAVAPCSTNCSLIIVARSWREADGRLNRRRRGAEILGIDPIVLANEGKLVPLWRGGGDAALAALAMCRAAEQAAEIGGSATEPQNGVGPDQLPAQES